MDDREGDTHPMETNIPETSTTGVKTYLSGHDLGLGLWEPFHLSEVLNLRRFTYDRKKGSIV
jgi:hypothetical protein